MDKGYWYIGDFNDSDSSSTHSPGKPPKDSIWKIWKMRGPGMGSNRDLVTDHPDSDKQAKEAAKIAEPMPSKPLPRRKLFTDA